MVHAAHSMPAEHALLQGALSRSGGTVDREFRIAGAIAEVARAEANCLGGARLLRIGVTVGADCNINLLCMREAFNRMVSGTDLEHVMLHLKSVPRRTVCHGCAFEFSSSAMVRTCPNCTSSDLELVLGDELELSFIEVERA